MFYKKYEYQKHIFVKGKYIFFLIFSAFILKYSQCGFQSSFQFSVPPNKKSAGCQKFGYLLGGVNL